jgi:hypothetical protein
MQDDGSTTYFNGNYAEYEADLKRRNGGQEPKRPKFRYKMHTPYF